MTLNLEKYLSLILLMELHSITTTPLEVLPIELHSIITTPPELFLIKFVLILLSLVLPLQ